MRPNSLFYTIIAMMFCYFGIAYAAEDGTDLGNGPVSCKISVKQLLTHQEVTDEHPAIQACDQMADEQLNAIERQNALRLLKDLGAVF